MGKSTINGHLLWKDPPCYSWVNQLFFDWAMFNSISIANCECLPEGSKLWEMFSSKHEDLSRLGFTVTTKKGVLTKIEEPIPLIGTDLWVDL
jgi:hypothetical protein